MPVYNLQKSGFQANLIFPPASHQGHYVLPSHVSTYGRKREYVDFLIYSFNSRKLRLHILESIFTLYLYKHNVIALNTHEMEMH